MEHTPIDREIYEALVCGFASMDKNDWHHNRIDSYVGVIPVQKYPEAFADGYELAIRVAMVYSADSTSDYRNDMASYERHANAINEKYGKIVVTDSDYEGHYVTRSWGFIGYRTYPFASTVKTKRNDDGTTETVIEHTRENINAEDEDARRKYGYPAPTFL